MWTKIIYIKLINKPFWSKNKIYKHVGGVKIGLEFFVKYGLEGVIKIKNSEDIIILSDFANYNKTTLDTYFYDNVRLTYDGHSIDSNELFMNYIDKNINIKDNVRYKGLNNKLYADILEIDLVTKFSKIYMLDKQKKVKVELKQNGSN